MRTEQEKSLINDRERQIAFIGGSLCMLIGARQRSWPGLVFGILGMNLLVHAFTGESLLQKVGEGTEKKGVHIPALQPAGLKMKESLSVNCSPEEAYQFWRDFENLPHFMFFLDSVEEQGHGRSHWILKAPAHTTLAWDVQIVIDQPNELIIWQTLPTAAVKHSGQVTFKPAPPGRGTEVTVELHYEPPGGIAGEAFAHLADTLTEQLLREGIRRFKAIMETGEIPTVENQPSGRNSGTRSV